MCGWVKVELSGVADSVCGNVFWGGEWRLMRLEVCGYTWCGGISIKLLGKGDGGQKSFKKRKKI